MDIKARGSNVGIEAWQACLPQFIPLLERESITSIRAILFQQLQKIHPNGKCVEFQADSFKTLLLFPTPWKFYIPCSLHLKYMCLCLCTRRKKYALVLTHLTKLQARISSDFLLRVLKIWKEGHLEQHMGFRATIAKFLFHVIHCQEHLAAETAPEIFSFALNFSVVGIEVV
jgi:hypothetical protein